MSQKETEWIPSAKQIALAELLVNPEDRRNKTEKMKAVDVSRKTFYEWMKDKRYLSYIKEQLEAMTDGELPDVWKAHMQKCKRGDMQAIKLYYEIKGIYVEKKEVVVTDKRLEDFF